MRIDRLDHILILYIKYCLLILEVSVYFFPDLAGVTEGICRQVVLMSTKVDMWYLVDFHILRTYSKLSAINLLEIINRGIVSMSSYHFVCMFAYWDLAFDSIFFYLYYHWLHASDVVLLLRFSYPNRQSRLVHISSEL